MALIPVTEKTWEQKYEEDITYAYPQTAYKGERECDEDVDLERDDDGVPPAGMTVNEYARQRWQGYYD